MHLCTYTPFVFSGVPNSAGTAASHLFVSDLVNPVQEKFELSGS